MAKVLVKQKIVPHLWYNREAKEAAELYVSIFNGSKITKIDTLQGTPSGAVDVVSLKLCGQNFVLISAGPYFKPNSSISMLVACQTKNEVEEIWKKLLPAGNIMMALGEYPFSERYGWLEDKYGFSWQVMFSGTRKIEQRITPTLMFTGSVCGKAEEAIKFYTSVFRDAKIGDILRYTTGEEPDRAGTVKHVEFTIEGQAFAAMDSARVAGVVFNEAISFIVNCQTQEEVDYYWGKLSANPKAEQCGWLKDKYGVSWQIVPEILEKLLNDKNPRKVAEVTEAFLKMKKLDIAALKSAYTGEK